MEKQLFNQMLERFLISADVPPEEIQLFMANREYEGSIGRRTCWERCKLGLAYRMMCA